MDYHDDDVTSINDLPDEVLLLVFKRLSLGDRIINVADVCDRWSTLVFTDPGTLKLLSRLLAHYSDNEATLLYDEVGRLEVECQLMYGPLVSFLMSPSQFSRLKFSSNSHDPWATVPRVRDRLRTLAISSQYFGIGRAMHVAKSMTDLTAVLLYDVRFLASDQKALIELGATCPHIRNVAFVSCKMSVHFDFSCLHRGFDRLQKFRLDNHPISDRFVDALLGKHLDSGLCMVVIGDIGICGDLLLDVLEDRLRSRPIRRLIACGRYFTAGRLRRFSSNVTVTEDLCVNVNYEDDVQMIDPNLFIELL